jgi:hypothetical protein
MPEPFRSGQAAIGLKALHAVPIFVEGQLWGWWLLTTAGEQSIKVWLNWRCVKTATVCIGSAIERDRTQAAILGV